MTRFRRYLLTAGLVLAALVVGTLVVFLMENRRESSQRRAVTEITVSQSDSVQRQLDRSLSATYALASILRQGNGTINRFEALADDMIRSYGGISSLQLAPEAIVSRIHPLAGNEKAIGHNLLADPKRRTEAAAAIDSKKLTLAGPVKLIQGGIAAIGRLPVFVPDAGGTERFWGFTIAVVKMDDFMRSIDLDRLDKVGYHYELWRRDPDTGKRSIIAQCDHTKLDRPVSHNIVVPNGRWTLSVSPRTGWRYGPSFALELGLVVLVGSMVGFTANNFFKQSERLTWEVKLRTGELRKTNRDLEGEIKERQRAEDQLRTSLKEKEVLLQEIHHRVKNNLQLISSLLELQSRHVPNPDVADAFTDSQGRLRTMALIHEELYQAESVAKINFSDYVRKLTNGLFHSYGADTNLIMADIDVDIAALDVKAAIPLGLIINELVSNCLKHAFPSGRRGEIRIGLERDGDEFTLVVADNGVGMPWDVTMPASGSLGLQLVDALVGQLDGSVALDRTKGTRFTITVPRSTVLEELKV